MKRDEEELAFEWEETLEYRNYLVPLCFPSFCRQKSDKWFIKKKKTISKSKDFKWV